MRMFLVQHYEGGEWVNSYREDLTTCPDVPLALFYTMGEADAYVTAMRGLIHTGGADVRFRLMNVEIREPKTVAETLHHIDTGDLRVVILGEVQRDVAPFADLPESPARDRALDRWRKS